MRQTPLSTPPQRRLHDLDAQVAQSPPKEQRTISLLLLQQQRDPLGWSRVSDRR